MRYLVSSTGERLHIVREVAYHGLDGQLVHGLCGAWPTVSNLEPVIFERLTPDRPPMCRTCLRIAKTYGVSDTLPDPLYE